MKKLQSILWATAGCLALVSCSDDDNGGSNNVSAELTGTYELTSAVAPQAQDYDNDGDSSTNLVLEGNCFNDSWISFHADGTYEEGFSYSKAVAGGSKIECETKVSTGTWARSGNEVTTTSSANVTTTYTFNSNARSLTRTESNGDYVGWNTAARIWANLTGSVKLTFEKYTDNSDDNGAGQDDDDNVNAEAGIFGDFDLKGFIVGTAQDLDLDGESSTNLATETTCYSNSTLKLKTDGTYERKLYYSVLNMANLTLDCETTTTTGTYTRIGDHVFTRDANGTINATFDIGSGNKLSGTWDNAQFPTYNSATELWAMLTGNVMLQFEKSGSN